MKKYIATLAAAAMMSLSFNCSAQTLDPVLEDVCCDGYQDACSICNLAPHWAVLALGVIAAVGVIVHNSACDAGHHHGHL